MPMSEPGRHGRTTNLALQRLLLVWLAVLLLLGHAPTSFADVPYKICPSPGICFTTKADKDNWAKTNRCKFLEDVCDKSAERDSAGAPEADRGFWRDLWDGVKGALRYGYQFVKGVVAGLKDQVTGIVALLTDFKEVVAGLVHLGKSFYDDPKGTATKLAEVLGNEVVDTIIRASVCGPYDLGKVIGQNVSPVLVAKLAIKISKFSGDIARAGRATKIELGCASFEAGTPVLTPTGPVPIERIGVGQTVLSRNERGFADAPQSVAKVFNRSVDHVHRLTTEFETLGVSDEHPLWLQGSGWTAVRELKRGDIIATASGDVTVLANERVERATRVFNFSVDQTPSYFVGEGVWAHNAACDLPTTIYRAPVSPSGYALGSSDGGPGAWSSVGRPDTVNYRYEKEITGAPRNVEYLAGGKMFDGYDSKRNVLLDAKNYEDVFDKAKPFSVLVDKTLADARNQIAAAGSASVEWHVSTKGEANALNAMFKTPPYGAPINIIVVWSPRITD